MERYLQKNANMFFFAFSFENNFSDESLNISHINPEMVVKI